MTNDRIERVEAALADLAVDVRNRTEARDTETSDERRLVATIDSRTGTVERALEALGSRLDRVEQAPKPGVLSFVGPALAAAIAVGSLGGFVLRQSLEPIWSEMANLTEWRTEQKADLRRVEERQRVDTARVEERQYAVRTELSALAGEVGQIEKQVDAMDGAGTREPASSRK